MLSYSIRRVLMLIPVLLGMSIVVFSIIRAIPGDPAVTILGEKASPKAIEDLREVLGLNNPWYIQYFDYLKQIITGDLGVSLHSGASITQE
ncbi:ABC transporter permease, partial [Bacillus sp. SIMBA_161]